MYIYKKIFIKIQKGEITPLPELINNSTSVPYNLYNITENSKVTIFCNIIDFRNHILTRV